jgi:uncharacterized protein YneR
MATDWHLGNISARFEPAQRRLLVTVGKRQFEPLAGAGPVLADGDGTLLPKAQQIELLESEQSGNTIRATYRSGTHTFVQEISTTDRNGVAEFRVRWHSLDRAWEGISPGVAVGLGRQQPFFFNRASEGYGQAAGGATFYCADADLWLFADWDVPVSNLSGFRKPRKMKPVEINTNFPVDLTPEAMAGGNLPFAVVASSVYDPDTNGVRLPLDDTLVLRVGKRMWDVVPAPAQPASPYREELGRSAFLDVWGGHDAKELTYKLRLLERILRGQVPCHTILQNWQAGGFDTLQPLSMRLPDYPPNPRVGTVAELRELCETGKRLGRFGFRTNYVYYKKHSPVVTSGEAHLAKNSDGSPARFVRLPDVLDLAQRQENEIAALFGANATFSDQLCSAGDCRLYMDHDAEVGSTSLRQTWARVKAICELLRESHNGPLSSETLNGDFLIGGWIDAGDYGMFGGHDRALVPDYKLRKLQHLTMFHGMALGYRFMFGPPYGGNNHHQEGDRLYLAQGPATDDYRACTVLYGNGAYLYLLSGMSWRQILSELVIVGRLQQRYALVPVASIEYYQPETRQWLDLETLAKSGVNVSPVRWIDQPTAMQIARVRYANGLEITVNRSEQVVDASCGPYLLQLPQYGWCAAMPDRSLVAFSANWPGTANRVDYLEDRTIQWRYLDPRDATVDRISRPTLAVAGRPVVELLPDDQLRIDGKTIAGHLPKPPPVTTIDFDFTTGRHGWFGAREILRDLQGKDGLSLRTCGHDPYIVGPELKIAPNTVKTLVIRLRSNEPGTAAFFWASEDAPSFRGNAVRTFPIEASDDIREYRIPIADHPQWQGKTITCLRFDPLAHDGTYDIQIQSLRGE